MMKDSLQPNFILLTWPDLREPKKRELQDSHSERININLGLLELGNVISALSVVDKK